MRRFVCIFLLFLLPLHAFAAQGGWLTAASSWDVAHEIEHTQGTDHHHADDGSIHYDDSDESSQHAFEHSSCQQTAALPSAALPPLNMVQRSSLVAHVGSDIPDAFLEQPQRPPSSLG